MVVWALVKLTVGLAAILGLLWTVNTVLAVADPHFLEADTLSAKKVGRCVERPFLRAFWPNSDDSDVDAERAANYYAQFAALAANTYSGDFSGPARFKMQLADRPWLFVDRVERPGGFLADIYQQWNNGTFILLVAFRGTDSGPLFWELSDAVSNLGPFTSQINPFDQYAAARDVMKSARAVVEKKANGANYAFIATGHSLGGGLARHVSLAFPCTAAVTFDASFVTNERDLGMIYRNQFVEIFEDHDLLPKLEHQLLHHPVKTELSAWYQWYRMRGLERYDEGVPQDQHQIVKFATALSRMAITCMLDTSADRDEPCAIPEKYRPVGSSIYCRTMDPSWRKLDDVCKNVPALTQEAWDQHPYF